jgi:photosystem II stability/assembly factor-like uncharacterized protein
MLAMLMAACTGRVVAQESWQPAGLPGTSVNRMKLASDGSVYAATDSGLYRSADNGASWNATPLKGKVEIVAAGLDNWIYASGAAGFSRSSDGGTTWSTMPIKDVRAKFGIVKAVAVDNEGRVYIGNNGPIWGSTDHSDTWAQLPGSGLPEGIPDIIVIEIGPGGELLAASWGIVGGDLYGSVDAGQSWIRLYDGDNDIQAIGAAPTGEYLISIYRSKLLYRSTDGGTSWSEIQVDPDISATPVVGFVFGPTAWYAVARGAGLLRSTDHGASWSMADAGLPGSVSPRAAVATSTGEILLGTSSGIYHLSTSSAVSEGATMSATGIHLYPNPAFDYVVIDYSLNRAGTVELSVVDLLGREVAAVSVPEGSSGKQSIRLATDRMPAGRYLYSLRVGDTLQQGGFTLMR